MIKHYISLHYIFSFQVEGYHLLCLLTSPKSRQRKTCSLADVRRQTSPALPAYLRRKWNHLYPSLLTLQALRRNRTTKVKLNYLASRTQCSLVGEEIRSQLHSQLTCEEDWRTYASLCIRSQILKSHLLNDATP